ncbi:helix-turn-helix transcriptional regulator [Treponema parvum]|uniref:Helix-turn-helix transcriptional regulator n=1 Tax=Treponema parvum TaxID=138851 RepID=A0A975EYK2_9SPIR|nr:helix-turn-helix domain-containing protein [Treponema parvum]QTQ11088.1 helix-turn-helix transcriptional regulator [Treponema parvum]QTQ16972.1 helix-turn-helix transcriptional regulator [Treponema parvum]
MYKKKLEDDIRCPLEYGMEVFGGKWNSRIICVLSAKKVLRYGELRSQLTDITDAVLSASLKELLKNNIIEREQYNEIPPHVEYHLSERGKSVVPILRSICRWAGLFHKAQNDKSLPQCKKCDYNGFNN